MRIVKGVSMKKVVLILLILCLSLVACQQNEYSNTNTNTHETERDTKTEFIIEEAVPTDEGFPTVCCHNYDEYLEFCSSPEASKLPDDFVNYDNIRLFGEFYEFSVDKYNNGSRYIKYTYALKDKLGQTEKDIYVTMGHIPESEISKYFNSYEKIDSQLIDPEFMSQSDSSENTLLEFNYQGIKYVYHASTIASIEWFNEGVYYRIAGDIFDYSFPVNEEELIYGLFNLDTALETVESIMESINGEATE